jgi:hypothetical protein
MKTRKKNKEEGISVQTNNADKKEESKTVLKDKYQHLYFKLKMLESWIFEKKYRKLFKDNLPTLKELELKQHNMKHEFNRVSKLLGSKK